MRVGIFRTCGLGDAAQITPLLQQIAADYPGASIDFCTSGNVAPLLEDHPLIARVIVMPAELSRRQGTPAGCLAVWNRVRRVGRWDMFLNLEPLWRRSMFFGRVRAERSAGFVTAGWKPWRLYTHQMPMPRDSRLCRRHNSQYYLELWQELTGHPDRGFGYNLHHLDKTFAKPLPIALPESFLCLAPGSGNFLVPGGTKRWPAANWVRLGQSLEAAGHTVVWLGAPEDRPFLDSADAKPVGWDLVGRLSLRETLHVLARGLGVIANDSGLFHVALALDLPAVGFYGPTDPTFVGPFRARHALVLQERLPCVPCFQMECTVQDPALAHLSRPYCMHLLTPEAVLPRILVFFAVAATNQPVALAPTKTEGHLL